MGHLSEVIFPTDQPLTAEEMIGRREDVREVAITLRSGGNLVITGPRRIGKTSVCQAALAFLREQGLYVVSVDLFRISSAAQLAETLVAQTISNRSTLRRLVHQTRRAGRIVADAAGTAAIIKSQTELGDAVEIAFQPGFAAQDPDRYLDYALELPGRIAEADGKSVVVFFDEFQEVASSTAPYGNADQLTKKMRSIFQASRGVTYLFAGSVEHLMRDLFTPTKRAFYQFGGFYQLRPIDEEVWEFGITARFKKDNFTIDSPAVRRIIELGEGHPRATMLLAQKTHLVSQLLDISKPDIATVEQGYKAALSSERASNEQSLDRIRHLHPLALEITQRIARTQPVYPNLSRGAVQNALEQLRNAAIIEHVERGQWAITNPLLKHYIQTLKPFD